MKKKDNPLYPKELTGFEDLYKHYMGDSKPRKKDSKDLYTKNKADDFSQTYNFLENEKSRLHQLASFFSSKMETLTKHPQTEKLIQLQEENIYFLKDDIVKKLIHLDSPLQQHLKYIWDRNFR